MTRPNVFSTWTRWLAIAAALLSGTIAYAQAPEPAPDDPPIRVGRMSFISGDVSFSPAGNDEWVQAQVNRPIVTGDQVWADNNGRAELSIDNSTWWLGEQTSLTVSNLDDRIAQFQLQQGTLEFSVRSMVAGNIVEVDTPNLAFTVTRPGRYRIVVDPQDGATSVLVRSGSADVYGENASYALATGQGYRFYGTDLRDSEMFAASPPDVFDRFVADRDRRYERSASVRYVSPQVVGYEDLDTYGTWSVQASYGGVWFPRTVRAGWAPYREGHWAWIDPWGWTWVDDEPWGFAPFHYGRWAHFDRGWGWIPGPRSVRPVYAPALVAFIGGSGFSISVSSGPAIGWFPLGPREVYRPPYRVSREYFSRVNVSNTVINQTNITNVYNNYRNNTTSTQVNYVNMRAPNAVTAVPPAVFAQSQNVGRAAVALPAAAIARAQVQPVARIAPARPAMLGAAPVARAKPPAASVQRAVVAKTAPPPPPVPDAQKLQALEKNPGQPLSPRQLQQLRQPTQAPARTVRVVEQAKPAANAAPPARPAGEGAARRAAQGPGTAPAPGPAGQPPVATPGQPPRDARAPGATPPPAPVPGSPATPPRERRGSPNAAEPPRAAPSENRATPGAPGVAPPATPGAPAVRGPQERPGARPEGVPQAPVRPPQSARPDGVTQEPARPPQSARPEAPPRAPVRPPEAARPETAAPPAATPSPRPTQQERGSEGRATPAEPRAAPQPPRPEARPQPQARQPEARPQPAPAEARPQAQPRPPEARPQPSAPPPQARPPEARPQPPAPPPQARPQPQAPQPQARPQPPAPPEARGGPPRGEPQPPQDRGKGNDRKDKEKDKDKDKP